MPRRMVGRKSAQSTPDRPAPKPRSGRSRSSRPRPARPVPKGPTGPPVLGLVLWPAVITLGVTFLRLGGERMGWSPRYFSTTAGGGLAYVGIAWLVPLVGAYFGYRLAREGALPSSLGRALGVPLVAVAVTFVLAAAGARLESASTPQGYLVVWGVSAALGGSLALWAWPLLGRALLIYALAARIPVLAVMWFAIQGDWGTHYDAAPPGFPPVPPLARWLWTGLLPQTTVWIAYTLVAGALGGVLGWVVAERRPLQEPVDPDGGRA